MKIRGDNLKVPFMSKKRVLNSMYNREMPGYNRYTHTSGVNTNIIFLALSLTICAVAVALLFSSNKMGAWAMGALGSISLGYMGMISRKENEYEKDISDIIEGYSLPKVRICPRCGAEFESNRLVCPACGMRLEDPDIISNTILMPGTTAYMLNVEKSNVMLMNKKGKVFAEISLRWWK